MPSVIRNEHGLEYEVEYDRIFADLERSLEGNLKKAFGTEQMVYDSMRIWKGDLKERHAYFLSAMNELSDELRERDLHGMGFFRPGEFWFVFELDLLDTDVNNLTGIFMDRHTWMDEVDGARIIFYSPPPSFPVDFILLSKDGIKCGGSKTSAASLATVAEDYLNGRSYSISAVIVECLYRSDIYAKRIHPYGGESRFIRDTDFGLKDGEGYVGAINSMASI